MRLAVSFLPLPLMLPGLSGANYIIIKAINQNTSLANTWPKDISTAFKGIIYHSIVIVLQSSSPLANHPTIPRHPRHGMVPANQPTVFDSWNRKKTPDIWVFMGLVGSYGCLRGNNMKQPLWKIWKSVGIIIPTRVVSCCFPQKNSEQKPYTTAGTGKGAMAIFGCLGPKVKNTFEQAAPNHRCPPEWKE